MKAYVEIVQRKERELGTDVLTHQKVHHFSHLLRFPDPILMMDIVEWRRVCGQPVNDNHGWYLIDGSYGQRCHRGSVQEALTLSVANHCTVGLDHFRAVATHDGNHTSHRSCRPPSSAFHCFNFSTCIVLIVAHVYANGRPIFTGACIDRNIYTRVHTAPANLQGL